MKLVLIRHGESAWNLENRFTGWTDVELSQTGVAEAKAAGVLMKEAGPETMKATVDVSEMMGSEIHLHVNCSGNDVVVRVPSTQLTAENRGGLAYGTEINITLPEDLIHLFDPETEKNLI